MKKIKSIITGILSGAVFFIAIQVGVAQENVKQLDNLPKAPIVKFDEPLSPFLDFTLTAEKNKAKSENMVILQKPEIEETGWYQTDAAGNLLIPLVPASETDCEPTGAHFCAREYKMVNGNPDPDQPTGEARKYND